MTDPEVNKVLVSGGSGLIGASLLRSLAGDRISVIRLVRRKPEGADEVQWNPAAGEPVGDAGALEGLKAAIHLSGANLSARRWSAAYKQEIVDSRVGSTRALVRVLRQLKSPPGSFLCASAIGIYGDRGDAKLT